MIDVAIDARITARMSLGVRLCVQALVRELPRAAPDLRLAFIGSGEHFTFREQVELPVRLARLRPRLVYYPSPLAPALRLAPYIVHVHDVIHVQFPQLFSRSVRLYYATLGAAVIRGARRVVVDDPKTVPLLERFFGVPAERAFVTPLGFDAAMLAESGTEARARPFFLYVGNQRPHKNLVALVEAWRSLPPGCAVDLVLAGPPIGTAVAPERLAGRELVSLGEVDERRLWQLYRGALAYVQPSIAEGFGLPMLEALALGTPVIASEESIATVLRPYVATFPAYDRLALGRLLERAANETGLRERVREGAGRVRSYTWDRFAESMAGLFREELARA